MSDIDEKSGIAVPVEGNRVKTCPGCMMEKSMDEFHQNRRRRDGRKDRCAICTNAAFREWKRENPDAWKAILVRHRRTPGFKKKHRERSRRDRIRHRMELTGV